MSEVRYRIDPFRKPRPIKGVNPDTCARKVHHATWLEAEEHLWQLVEQDHREGRSLASLGLVSYRCKGCGDWHVGHGIGTDPVWAVRSGGDRRARGNVGEALLKALRGVPQT